MPIHDWKRVGAGTYHAFHCCWIAELQKALNVGLLPEGYYALAEQGAEVGTADVLTLQSPATGMDPPRPGGIAVADAPPRVGRRLKLAPNATYRTLRRTLAIRHTSGHRVVALIEITSPANKDRPESVATFVDKVESALDRGVHVLVIDLLAPGRHDPLGLPGTVLDRVELVIDVVDHDEEEDEVDDDIPGPGHPPALVSLMADRFPEAFAAYPVVGDALPEMPLFLKVGTYVNIPLEPTYDQAYRGMPAFWRDVLEGRRDAAPDDPRPAAHH